MDFYVLGTCEATENRINTWKPKSYRKLLVPTPVYGHHEVWYLCALPCHEAARSGMNLLARGAVSSMYIQRKESPVL